ncbi:MAG: hypothetical protein KDD02_25640 [Phaeodactylibacter sp.]|nr:hypothetical protein [Phaeodactylibacter sp.]
MSEFKQVVQEGKKKVVSGIKRIVLILLALAIVGGASYVWVCGWTYSQGTRAGTLIKISDKGVVFKTYEGQLNLGGFQQSSTNGVVGNIWDFSVAKRDIFEKLQNYEGKQVKLAYKQRYKAFPWQGDTEYFVVSVEEVK